MVVQGIRYQETEIRKSAANAKAQMSLTSVLKYICVLFVLLNTEYWALNTTQAKCFGAQGVIYPINEQNPIALIQQKLKTMEESGELEQRNRELQKRTRAAVERPTPVEGITKATKNRAFYYDPTYEVKEDLYDHQGKIFAKKGTKLNPLNTVSLSSTLLFFDGDDEDQLAWVKGQQVAAQNKEQKSIKLILVKGAPLKLSEELGTLVYFDQSGILTKKLEIQHVPVLITQEGQKLKVEEISLPPTSGSQCSVPSVQKSSPTIDQ